MGFPCAAFNKLGFPIVLQIEHIDLKFKDTSKNVIPAKAGIHKLFTLLDSRRSLLLT